MLKKASRVSLVEQVAVQIEELIESGQWKVGDKLPPEMELMDQFGVSRNTLREAIRALVHSGLLETRQGSGTVVQAKSSLSVALHRHFEASDLIETLEVRLALEREAAHLAAERRTVEDLQEMEKRLHDCEEAVRRNDSEMFVSADVAFHQAIVKAAKNKTLLELYGHMTDAVQTSIEDFLRTFHFQSDHEIHYGLFEAIRKGDVPGASAYVDDYINGFKNRLTEISEG